MKSFREQFAHPTGLAGEIVGILLAYENRERNAWAIGQLHLQADDHVLEIGFGPGLAIELAARSVLHGLVAGVDHSTVMVRQAERRNHEMVHAGKVILKQGTAEKIPFADSEFDKAFAVNSFHQWPDQVGGMREVMRVLKPGGWFAIVEQPLSALPDAEIQALASDLEQKLKRAGFRPGGITRQPMKPAATICVVGIKG